MRPMKNPDGPLKLPAGLPMQAHLAASEHLRGHATAADWLPEGLSPVVDKLRARQLAQRGRLAEALDALSAFDSAMAAEDSAHEEALRDAQRAGPTRAENKRTPLADRESARAELLAVIGAGVEVMAEVAQQVIAGMRQAEDGTLAGLRRQAGEADALRADARRKMAEADAVSWRLARLGQWTTATTDGGPFGAQPAPALSTPPPRVDPSTVRDALERPWHKLKPWNGKSPSAPQQAGSEAPAQDEPAEAVSGAA